MKAALLGPSRVTLASGVVVALLALGLFATLKPVAITVATLLALLTVATIVAAFRRPRHAVANGTARAVDGHLTFAAEGRELTVPREEIVAARVTSQTLVVDRGWRRRNVRLRFERGDEARALVAELGLDATKVRDRFPTHGPADPRLSRAMWWVGIAIGLALSLVRKQMGFAFVGVILAQLLLSLASHLDIGPDGIHMRWLFWTWFVPTRDIVGVMRIR